MEGFAEVDAVFFVKLRVFPTGRSKVLHFCQASKYRTTILCFSVTLFEKRFLITKFLMSVVRFDFTPLI